MCKNNFYTLDELKDMGFKSLGEDVLISRKTSIFRPERISIGNHVRIDDFCLLSGFVTLHNYIHIAAYSAFFGGGSEIEMEDFSGLAYRSTIVAETDDYLGDYLTNPTVPLEYRKIEQKKVHIGKHVVLGTGAVVLPGVVIGEGCTFGALALVNRSTEPWGVYIGTPARRIKERSKNVLILEKGFLKKEENEINE